MRLRRRSMMVPDYVDITHADMVELKIEKVGEKYRLWVNTEEGCVCRIYRIKDLVCEGFALTRGESEGDL